MALVIIACTVLVAYLIGAILRLSRARSRGVDILQQGSGNIGATTWAECWESDGIVVFVFDFAMPPPW